MEFFDSVPSTYLERVETLSMDMHGAYISAAMARLPRFNEQVVFDKFHVEMPNAYRPAVTVSGDTFVATSSFFDGASGEVQITGQGQFYLFTQPPLFADGMMMMMVHDSDS